MNGTEVFNFAIKEVPKLFREYYQCQETNNDAYDLFVLHQANQFMLNYIAKKVGFSKDKMPLSLDRYGNTSSASIPLTLCDYFNKNKEAQDLRNQNVIISGFGVGLSLGITSFLMDGKQCLPIIRVKEGWDDGVL